MKYILVEWPKSQQFMFMEDNRCLQCVEIEGGMFVPEDVYDYYINGNVINAKKIVLEKKEKDYPKTYAECCEIVKIGKEHTLEGSTIRINYKIALLESFQKLLICRDAYWKIAGNEMGLNKSWKPDWNNISDKYCIYFVSGEAWLKECQTRQCPFAFPTAEMRDAFYENFKELIEECKELL